MHNNVMAYTWDDREKIRRAYEEALPEIMEAYEHGMWADPYDCGPIGIWWKWSPAEYAMWGCIRSYRVMFYPEFPIGRFFADFADPFHKIVIEVDGKEFHADRYAEDAERDRIMQEDGWTVYRIWARYCLCSMDDTFRRELGCSEMDLPEYLRKHELEWRDVRRHLMYRDADCLVAEIRERHYADIDAILERRAKEPQKTGQQLHDEFVKWLEG